MQEGPFHRGQKNDGEHDPRRTAVVLHNHGLPWFGSKPSEYNKGSNFSQSND